MHESYQNRVFLHKTFSSSGTEIWLFHDIPSLIPKNNFYNLWENTKTQYKWIRLTSLQNKKREIVNIPSTSKDYLPKCSQASTIMVRENDKCSKKDEKPSVARSFSYLSNIQWYGICLTTGSRKKKKKESLNFLMFANFCAVNAPIVTNFRLPMCLTATL